MNSEQAFWILVALFGLLFAVAVYGWVTAQLDERRWRRRMEEVRKANLIREHRYGAKGGSRG